MFKQSHHPEPTQPHLPAVFPCLQHLLVLAQNGVKFETFPTQRVAVDGTRACSKYVVKSFF